MKERRGAAARPRYEQQQREESAALLRAAPLCIVSRLLRCTCIYLATIRAFKINTARVPAPCFVLHCFRRSADGSARIYQQKPHSRTQVLHSACVRYLPALVVICRKFRRANVVAPQLAVSWVGCSMMMVPRRRSQCLCPTPPLIWRRSFSKSWSSSCSPTFRGRKSWPAIRKSSPFSRRVSLSSLQVWWWRQVWWWWRSSALALSLAPWSPPATRSSEHRKTQP